MPTDHQSRSYNVFLLCPGGHAYSLTDAVRSNQQYLGQMTVIPAPSESQGDSFGIMTGGGFNVEIADETPTPGQGVDGLGVDWYIFQEDGSSKILLENGSGSLIQEY